MKKLYKHIHNTATGLFVVAFAAVVFVAGGGTVDAAGKNNFTISNYDIQYELGRDAGGRSILKTVETITADFTQENANHGIERYIPKTYDDHPVSLSVLSVTDGSGQKIQYKTYDQKKFTIVRIGDADRYVFGTQTYEITYTQRDITKNFEYKNISEFYWDTNGTAWKVPITKLSVTLKIDESILSELTGKSACYKGSYGEDDECTIEKVSDDTFAVSSENLASGENVTVAVGFNEGVFAAYQKSTFEILLLVWIVWQIITTIIAIGLIIFFAIKFSRLSNRKREMDTVVPEYLPPKDTSVQTAALLVQSSKGLSAQLIDFAVRHYIQIRETKSKGGFSKAEYEFAVVKPVDDLLEEEKEVLRDIFNTSNVVPGKVTSTKALRKDTHFSMRLNDNPTKLRLLVRGAYGLREKDEKKTKQLSRAAKSFLVAGIVLASVPFLIVAAVVAIMARTLYPLTDKGLALRRYLDGLKLYIGVAEQERLKLLQSPEGAQKVQIDSSDSKQLVKLYERVLPYAILFGQEREWNERIGEYYVSSGEQPDWYAGSLAGFSAATLSSTISDLTSSIDASSGSSSSSGGSSGGGFSGGGGGGGGGGGW